MKREHWLDVPGYRGMYKVSDRGQVISLPRTKTTGGKLKGQVDKVKELLKSGLTQTEIGARLGVTQAAISYLIKHGKGWKSHSRKRVLSPSTDSYGYLVVGLTRIDETMRTRKVHRLVAAAFIPNPENKPEVNHKDGNKKNNSVSNLEWVTRPEHDNHKRLSGQYKGSKNGNSKITEQDVMTIRQRLAAGEKQADIAQDYNISQVMVSLIKRRKHWTHC